MRFHLLDRIDAWYPGEHACGVKAITRTDGSGGRLPLVESLAQLSSFLLGDAEAREGRRVLSLLVGLERLAFLADPRPGDRLSLRARIVARAPEGARVEVEASVDGRAICAGMLKFAFFAAETPEQARDFAWTWELLLQLARGCREGDPPRALPEAS